MAPSIFVNLSPYYSLHKNKFDCNNLIEPSDIVASTAYLSPYYSLHSNKFDCNKSH